MPDDQKLNDEIHAALCANHMTGAVADFLTDLAARIRRLEKTNSNESKGGQP